MKVWFSLFVVFGALAFASACKVSYEGYQVLRVLPLNKAIVERLQLFSTLPGFSYWRDLKGHDRPVDILISPELQKSFISQMEFLDAPTYLLIRDVQKLIDEQKERNEFYRDQSKSSKSPRIDHTFYRTLTEINAELDNFEAAFPALFSSTIIGTTFEGRDLRLSKVSADGTDTRPVIWIDCGIHAREWVSPSTCLYFLDQLTTYGVDAEVTALLDQYDFNVLTITNPDGYEFSWTDDRLWRKNRTPNDQCFGVDLNRNFDSDFGGAGTSDVACFDTYHGPGPFSELETQAIRDTVLSLGPRLKAFYTLHSYSQYWMTPYGYTATLPTDYSEMLRVTTIGVEALTAVYGTVYLYGNIADVIYLAAGGSVDWTYDAAGIVYSFALELRDQGLFGFTLPPEQIEPTGIETWAGVKASIQALL